MIYERSVLAGQVWRSWRERTPSFALSVLQIHWHEIYCSPHAMSSVSKKFEVRWATALLWLLILYWSSLKVIINRVVARLESFSYWRLGWFGIGGWLWRACSSLVLFPSILYPSLKYIYIYIVIIPSATRRSRMVYLGILIMKVWNGHFFTLDLGPWIT